MDAWFLIKSNERIEHFYKGLDDFFSVKSIKICSHSILIFRGLTSDFFKFSSFPLAKGRRTPKVKQQKCNDHKKRDRLLLLEKDFNVQIFEQN